MTTELIYYDWTPEEMLEVVLPEPDNFLKVRETLTRIGIASRKDKTLYQSCHILHKQGRYFIVHFKELFALDGKEANLTLSDVERRNTIARLLEDWGLLKISNAQQALRCTSLSQIKIVAFKEKDEWNLVAKYSIGNKKSNVK
jgi:endonuclease III